MALIIASKEQGTVRPGDVMFSYHPQSAAPLHVGIYVGREEQKIDPDGDFHHFDVCSVPRQSDSSGLGTASWPDGTGTGNNWRVAFIGQRRDVEPSRVARVALYAKHVEADHSLYGAGKDWGFSWLPCFLPSAGRMGPTGQLLFQSGTCAQFVELMYEWAELDLVDQELTKAPEGKLNIRPATQMYAFWSGIYPLRVDWDPRLASYPGCLEVGERCNER